jgi:hypothetical protein
MDEYTKRFLSILREYEAHFDASHYKDHGLDFDRAKFLAEKLQADLYVADFFLAQVDPSQAEFTGECPACMADVSPDSTETHSDECPIADLIIARGDDEGEVKEASGKQISLSSDNYASLVKLSRSSDEWRKADLDDMVNIILRQTLEKKAG